MRNILILCAFFATVITGTNARAQDVMYVQSAKAKIMSGPSFKSVVMGTVSRGTRFLVLGKDASWIKVKFDYQHGYVPALVLSQRPPMTRVNAVKIEQADLGPTVRRRASTFASAAAARGLTAEDRRRMSREESSDFEALQKVEAVVLGADEVSKFQEGLK